MPAFDDVGILATSSTTRRDSKTRWAEFKNVKDFGATGNGVTNDQPFIQAAVDWQTATGFRGKIYFPAGTYLCNSAVTFNWTGSSHSIHFCGDGIHSIITGSVAGFLISRTVSEAVVNTVDIIERLQIVNNSTNINSGAIEWNSASNFTIRNCHIQGFNGVRLKNSLYCLTMHNCVFDSIGLYAGSVGAMLLAGGGSTVHSCDFLGWDEAIRMATGLAVIGCRIESCITAIVIGRDWQDNDASVSCALLASISFEANVVGVYAKHCNNSTFQNLQINGNQYAWILGSAQTSQIMDVVSITRSSTTATLTSAVAHGLSNGTIIGIYINPYTSGEVNDFQTVGGYLATITGATTMTFTCAGTEANASGATAGMWSMTSQYGIRFGLGEGNVFSAITVNGWHYGGAIKVNGTGQTRQTFMNVLPNNAFSGAVNWDLPSGYQQDYYEFLNCANLPSLAHTFALLPTSPPEGMERNLTDCNTATWGATAAGSGANHVNVRYNGTNWTVVGK